MPLKLASMQRVAEMYGLGSDDVEMMVALEHVGLEIKREKHEARAKERDQKQNAKSPQ